MASPAVRERGFLVDVDLQLKDAGLVASTAVAQVGGVDKIVDLGAATMTRMELNVDVSAIEIASSDELYIILLEGSSSATFASDIEELACLRLGDNAVLTGGGDVDSDAGRYVVPCTNERNGRHYRYVRAHTVVAGTVATGINYTAFLSTRR